MNELEIWRGLDLSQYQLGDIIIISEIDMMKQFKYGFQWRPFQQKVEEVAKKIGMHAVICYNDVHGEYEIHLLEDRPALNKTAIPDAEISMCRRKVWKRNQYVHEDGNVTEDVER